MQGINNDILEKKFKILRTSIMLGSARNREELLAEYADVSKEIDRIRRGIYEDKITSMMYTTTTLEEERDRLRELILLIEERVKERNNFIDDYIKVTNNFLDDLPGIIHEDELSQYRDRLANIDKYLNNCEEIKSLGEQLKNKKKQLEEKYESKASNEIINQKLEDELIDEFSKLISDNEYYMSLNYSDIDSELAKISGNLNDKKDVMNTFISSYDALRSSGISGSEREEYLSYVNSAKEDYYSELEKKYMLNIYKLILDKKNDYDSLLQKRLHIDEIIKDRIKSRRELNITLSDNLSGFINICNEQLGIIKAQKINLENIGALVLEIAECENKLEELDSENGKVEVLTLLNEFSLEKLETPKIEMPTGKDIVNKKVEDVEDTDAGEPKPSNMVVSIKEPIKINVKNATDMAKLVMKKVVIVLEPKRFNNKRDKLKEAEKELEEIKNKKNEEEKSVLDTSVSEKSDDILLDKDLEKDGNSTFVTFDASNDTEDTSDDVFIKEPVNINLETKEDDMADTEITTDSIKFDLDEEGNASVPTEIFIEEPKEEAKVDLFSQTDPFLDDNQFEIETTTNTDDEEVVSAMPKIGSIGTVKPTNMLSKLEKIEEATLENEDVVLPTMGLTNDDKTTVPIVSENYIN